MPAAIENRRIEDSDTPFWISIFNLIDQAF